jgi:hypothetical protein
MYIDDGGVTRGSEDTYKTNRPQNNVSLDGNSLPTPSIRARMVATPGR